MTGRRSRGALEAAVMRALWDAGRPLSAAEVRAAVPADAPALTTVLTVLQRLHAKHRVERGLSPEGTLTFRAADSESGHTAATMLAALLTAQDRSEALLRFAGTLDEQDVALLRRALHPPGPED